jgi:hypothetical protein
LWTTIEANTKAAWRENGLIMLHIRNAGLYKAKYGTFEAYLEKRWDLSARHGQRMIAGVEFVQKLDYCNKNDSEKGDQLVALNPPVLPQNEGQVRPLLTCLNHDGERIKVWADVVQDGERDHHFCGAAWLLQKYCLAKLAAAMAISIPTIQVTLSNFASNLNSIFSIRVSSLAIFARVAKDVSSASESMSR